MLLSLTNSRVNNLSAKQFETMRFRRRESLSERPIRQAPKALFLLCSLILVRRTLSQDACYETLGSLNSVMQTELVRIQNGATPQDAYMYNLCNNTFFDATTTILEPVLNNAMFICGDDGSRLGRCVILGGSLQVEIVDSLVDTYPLQEISFMGITFSSFESNTLRTGTSIGAFASSVTTATFTDCAWEEFTSDFVIRQNATGAAIGSMTVEVERSIISAGSSGVIFDNNGGLLRINEIELTDISAAAFLATANNGASFVSGMSISLADVNSITFTTAGGSQTITNSTVTQMTRMADAFYVEDTSSTLLLEDVNIVRNQIQADSWSAVAARAGAIAQISNVTIAENAGVEFGVVSFNSMVTIQDTIIRQNTGSESTGTPSAPIFAITDAQVTLNRVQLIDNTDFSGSVVALIRSSVTINRSCFQGSSSEFLVFVANDATFMVSENFVENYISNRCQATGPRLFQENEASGCFLGSSTCEGTCLVLADQTRCLADDFVTIAPVITTAPMTATPAATPILSTAPTASPMLVESMMPSVVPTKNESVVPTTIAPSARPETAPTLPPKSISPDGRPSPTRNPTSKPTAVPSTSFEPSASVVPSFSSFPSFVPSFIKTQKPSLKKMKMCMGKMMGKGMSMGKGKGMKMGKGSDHDDGDDDDDECEDDIGKGSKMGKGSKKGGKGGGGKGLMFVPEYDTLWSPSSPSPPRPTNRTGTSNIDLATVELLRQERHNATNTTTNSSVPTNSTNVTDVIPKEENRNSTNTTIVIPTDKRVR